MALKLFQVDLKCDGVHMCGGVVYNNKTLLTAAHCCKGFVNNKCKEVQMDIGTRKLKLGQRRILNRTLIHPNYK